MQVDSAAAQAIHPNNVKRVIRALEYFHQTGERISEHNEEEAAKTSPYNYIYFVLNNDRAVLYDRIDKRVDAMFDAGLVEEVTALRFRPCPLHYQTGYQTFCQAADYMV